MARARTADPPALPPPTAWACWREFLKWVLGLPLAVAGALAAIWAGTWALGGDVISWQTESAIGDTLFYVAVIVLLYPIGLVFWVIDLRDGLRAARAWAAMTEAERAAALAAQAEAAAAAAKPRRTRRGKG